MRVAPLYLYLRSREEDAASQIISLNMPSVLGTGLNVPSLEKCASLVNYYGTSSTLCMFLMV